MNSILIEEPVETTTDYDAIVILFLSLTQKLCAVDLGNVNSK